MALPRRRSNGLIFIDIDVKPRSAFPRVGITCSRHHGRLMWWFNRLAVSRAGGHAVRLTPGQPVDLAAFDALIIGGGDDIDATLYNGAVEPTIRVDRERDLFELGVLSAALRDRLPVLGICRGAQMINIFLGGTLHGCIYTAYRDAKPMRTALPRKWVTIESGTKLAELLGLAECRVNALHHQSIDRLAEPLRVVARDDVGIVQAVEGSAYAFLIGVQWHPEFLVLDPHQQRLFTGLIAAARHYRARNAEAAPALV